MECEIEVRHFHTAIGIPHAAGADVKQTLAGLGQDLSTIDEAEDDFLALLRALRQNYGDQIITSAGEMRAFDRGILQEFDWLAIRFNALDV